MFVVLSTYKSPNNFEMKFYLVESFGYFSRKTLTVPLWINGLGESPKTKRVKQKNLIFGAGSLT